MTHPLPPSSRRIPTGFTLIELLVVISIIALLIGILLPVLGSARAESRAIQCASHQRQVGIGLIGYMAENNGVFPASYLSTNAAGNVDLNNQPATGGGDRGYIHWSYTIAKLTEAPEAFSCPEFEDGGLPRTNPGPDGTDWANDQIDDQGQTSPNPRQDKQVARVAFALNGAVTPRNKFTPAASGGTKVNIFVGDQQIKEPSNVISAVEFSNDYRVSSEVSGPNYLVKSHRPINPFQGFGSGTNIYGPGAGYFVDTSHVSPEGSVAPGAIANKPLDAVGRHHPGGFSFNGNDYGGTSNFLFYDGHGERLNIVETLIDEQWGDNFYSIRDLTNSSSAITAARYIGFN